jgi:hypothetical protein
LSSSGGIEIQSNRQGENNVSCPSFEPFNDTCQIRIIAWIGVPGPETERNRLIFEIQTTLEQAMREYGGQTVS